MRLTRLALAMLLPVMVGMEASARPAAAPASGRLIARPVAPAAGPEVWFAPLQDEPSGEQSHGSVDPFDLFERDAPWKRAAGHVDVFKI